ncbi:unnamed protein product [Prunus armeniaca]
MGDFFAHLLNQLLKIKNPLWNSGILEEIAKPFNMDRNTASSTGCRWFWFKARCKAKGCP